MTPLLTSHQTEWLRRLQVSLPRFMARIGDPEQPGRYLPCTVGLTATGRLAALGFSCFALKIFHTLDLFGPLPEAHRTAWVDFIRSYQVQSDPEGSPFGAGGFLDQPLLKSLPPATDPPLTRWKNRMLGRQTFSPRDLAINAESKQAIATLAQVGSSPRHPFRGFPTTAQAVEKRLRSYDWTRPWGAGGQTAALVVMICTQVPLLGGEAGQVDTLSRLCRDFFDTLANPETGGYYQGPAPKRGQLVNGAMKVITALDWLETPIHYPERLLDTCLAALPAATGCNLVDAVYILHRCLKQTNHRRQEAVAYCREVLAMVQAHHREEGGFSYHLETSQTHYYGAQITRGEKTADIHGTCLLTWAVAMILDIVETPPLQWRVIRP